MNMIRSFEAATKCLQKPYMNSHLFSSSNLEMINPQAYNFWKWGALVLALLATFSSIIRRIKNVFIHLHSFKLSPRIDTKSNDFEFSGGDDDDDDECCSVASQDEEASSPTTSFQDHEEDDEDFCVKGSKFYFRSQWQNGNLINRRRQHRGDGGDWFHLSEFTSRENVVKLWDYNYLTVESPPVMIFTAEGKGDRVVLGGYDMRMRRRLPAISADWQSPADGTSEMVVTGGVEKVYAKDCVTGILTIGDMRKLTEPLGYVAEFYCNTWRDDDFLMFDQEW